MKNLGERVLSNIPKATYLMNDQAGTQSQVSLSLEFAIAITKWCYLIHLYLIYFLFSLTHLHPKSHLNYILCVFYSKYFHRTEISY